MSSASSPLGTAALLLALTLAGCTNSAGEPSSGAELAASRDQASIIGPPPGTDPVVLPAAGYHDSPPARSAGRALFTAMNCAGCHGSHAGGGMGPSLRDSTWIFGGEPSDIFNTIRRGRPNGMPAWATRIPQPQVWSLVAYIKSLGTPGEPAPPPPIPPIPPASQEPTP